MQVRNVDNIDAHKAIYIWDAPTQYHLDITWEVPKIRFHSKKTVCPKGVAFYHGTEKPVARLCN